MTFQDINRRISIKWHEERRNLPAAFGATFSELRVDGRHPEGA
jgi:hypothetical protein